MPFNSIDDVPFYTRPYDEPKEDESQVKDLTSN